MKFFAAGYLHKADGYSREWLRTLGPKKQLLNRPRSAAEKCLDTSRRPRDAQLVVLEGPATIQYLV